MSFRITGLSPAPFRHLVGLFDAELQRHGAQRCAVDSPTGFPDRIELCDCVPGETVLLLNYMRQPADTPYRASHAIFVREGATAPYDAVDVVPTSLQSPLLSLRAFTAAHGMVDADAIDGADPGPAIDRLLGDPRVAYVHAITRSALLRGAVSNAHEPGRLTETTTLAVACHCRQGPRVAAVALGRH